MIKWIENKIQVKRWMFIIVTIFSRSWMSTDFSRMRIKELWQWGARVICDGWDVWPLSRGGAGGGAVIRRGRISIFFCHVGGVISQILRYRNISATVIFSQQTRRRTGFRKILETWNGIHKIFFSHLKFYLELKTFNTTFDLIEFLGWSIWTMESSKLSLLRWKLDT